MDKDLIRKWVDALRSGKYKQGLGSLCPKSGSYCCLGVAGLVAGFSDEDLGLNTVWTNEISEAYKIPRGDNSGVLSFSPSVRFQGRRLQLHNLNDSKKLTFPQIAGLIEAEWLGENNEN